MTVVPSELYRALLNFGIEHDEAVELSRGVPAAYAQSAGPVLLAMSKRFRSKMDEIERRLTDLETEWGP